MPNPPHTQASFPRGPGPLVSILLATRGRPAWLCQSVDSLVSLAQDQSWLEFVFFVDDDDAPTREAVGRIIGMVPFPCRLIVASRGRGYADMHLRVDAMASAATGDWLFIWGDDVLMKTHGWDNLIHTTWTATWHGVQDVFLMMARTEGRPHAQEFPILRRKVFEILGHVGLSPHADNWIWTVMNMLRSCAMHPTIEVQHFSGVLMDQIRKENEAVFKNSAMDTLESGWAVKAKLRDAAKLLFYCIEHGGDVGRSVR